MSVHKYANGNSPTDAHVDAHGSEQNPPNPKFRTKLCRNYPLGTCRYGEHCSYLHILPVSSPATQHPSPIHTFARSPFYPSISPSLSQSLSCSTSYPHVPAITSVATPSYRAPGDSRALIRPRPDGPRRFAATVTHTHTQTFLEAQSGSSSGSEVERWRLAVSADGAYPMPPAPPATPVSVPGGLVALSPAVHNTRAARRDSPASASAVSGGVGGVEKASWAGSQWQSDTLRECPSAASRRSAMPKLAKHRNQYFKTKPCRFYAEPGGCIKGDRCNFIHEHSDEARCPSGLTAPAPELVSEGELESGAESSIHAEATSTAATSDHTPSIESPEKKNNFYPVTWRVVGGGVMMSGQREVCESFMTGHCSEGADCQYAHPDTNDEDYISSYPEPPPIYSPISPVFSPVAFAYPFVYPALSSPLQPVALPAVSGHVPAASPISITPSHTPQNGLAHSVLPRLTITPISQAQPSGFPYLYSPHKVVDGSTLVEREGAAGECGEVFLQPAARSVVRPVSTPPTPVQGPDAGVVRLFAAEMP